MKLFMKSLKEYIYEGLLDRVKNKEVNHKVLIEEFLEANYHFGGSYTIKDTNNGFIVDARGDIMVENKNITSLTNGLFEFGSVDGFYCDDCKSLTSLKGAPRNVELDFYCTKCDSLKSLEGAPEFVQCSFNCRDCKSLKTLEGAPKEVWGCFM